MKVKDVQEAVIEHSLVTMRPVGITILGIPDDLPIEIADLDVSQMSREEIEDVLDSEVVAMQVVRRLDPRKGPLFLVWGRMKTKNRA